jgi:signal transduction histidine kinase
MRDNLLAARAQAAKDAREYATDFKISRRLAASVEQGRLRALASAASRLGPFEGWLLATQELDGFKIRAAHGVPRNALKEPDGALKQALRRRITVSRGLNGAAVLHPEERLFQRHGYRAYLCVPFQGGVVGLLSRKAIAAATRERVARFFGNLEPHLKSRYLTQELERQRALVRGLVRGLFSSADAERASLRRDLHDDFAQLLAAAQIALDSNREDARRFFRELEGHLRSRLDALRPQQSQRRGFKATIALEVRRLQTAGIDVTLSVRGDRRLPATVKEVVCRVIREGVSNVIRHAAASRVQLEVECNDGVARTVIIDNGRGASNGSNPPGTGLRGLAERVEVLGGSCRLESKAGQTCLSAQIPVANL